MGIWNGEFWGKGMLRGEICGGSIAWAHALEWVAGKARGRWHATLQDGFLENSMCEVRIWVGKMNFYMDEKK